MKTDTIKGVIKDTRQLTVENEKGRKSFLGKVTAATLYYGALRILRRVTRTVISTVKELDKSITEVAMVTGMSRERTIALTASYQRLAREVGGTTAEIAKLSVFFFRQGRSAADALELTKVAATAAKVASIDATKSANFLTSAVNGFGLAADQAMAVSDKFAALGASSASSYEEMAIALSKVAPVAKVAGVGIDFMMAALAKGIETTREAPENIGTAFKTIFARMTQIRDFGATLDDSVGVNKVEEALKQANVALRDSTGNFRDMDIVLTELGHAFEGLTRNQQSYIATALAGTRQQSRLLAVMQNFDRTMELVNVSLTASGATLAQHSVFMEGMEGATARLSNSFQGLILAFSDSETVISIVDGLASAVEKFTGFVERAGVVTAVTAGIMGVALVAALIGAKTAAALAQTGVEKLTIALIAKSAATALATGGMSLILPAIIAVVGAIGLFLTLKPETKMQKMAKSSAEMTKAAEKSQVAIFNLNKEGNKLKELSNRYNTLKNQVVKTADEIKEMNELGQELTRTLQTEHNIVVTGDLDADARLALEAIKIKQTEALEGSIGLGEIRFEQVIEAGGLQELQNQLIKAGQPLSTADLDSLKQFVASKMFGIEFINADIVDQKRMLELAEKNLIQFSKEQADFQNLLNDTIEQGNNFLGTRAEINEQKRQAQDADPDAFFEDQRINTSQGFGEIVKALRERGLMPENLDDDQALDFVKSLDASIRNSHGTTAYEAAGLMLSINDFEAMISLNKDMIDSQNEKIRKIKDDFAKNQLASGQDILGLADLFESVLDGSLDESDVEKFFDDLLKQSDSTQKAVIGMTEGLGGLVGLSIENISTILQQDIKDISGRSLTGLEKSGIAQILENNGFSIGEITAFFQNMTNFTADGIAGFVKTIQNETRKSSTATDLFAFLTDDASAKKFNQTLVKLKNDTNTILELQEKAKSGELSADEFDFIADTLGDSELLKDFREGTLTAEAFAGARAEQLKNDIAEAMAATMNEIDLLDPNDEKHELSLLRLNNQLMMYEDLLNNVEQQVFNSNMADFYQSQIDFITEMNQKIQEEIDLEQRRLDMNRSMLSLNRQIAALERDTSFGAQARLEDLRMTRSQEAAQRESFIRDTIANQNISELQDKIQSGIAKNTALSAAYLEKILKKMGGSPEDFTVIESTTGVRLANSFNNRLDDGGSIAIVNPRT
jgi:TP901 family phage tail tape measure protein